ncbi:MAG: 4Fe-4S dicluster domain-containing protein [Magnetococcales bacterium]|nr:4Fe-4S dicluster domain-containing protein [Magnetococcales bacterium]
MNPDPQRRKLLATLGTVAAAPLLAAATDPEGSARDALLSLLQTHYLRMSREEIAQALARIERRALRDHGVAIRCRNTPPIPGVSFAMALNLSKCKGLRHCVGACSAENNNNRGQTTENIRVLALPRHTRDLERSDHYYTTLGPDSRHLPVQCQQCDNPPCVQACPVQATWKEPDGMVVIDYDWCIGCRYCATACPYWARRFNWRKPSLAGEGINPDTHYLGNRPRPAGVMEKCTFCIQRTRLGQLPACQEACPTGARIFGNLLDPDGELRYILEHKSIFRLKEELGTEPRFWYFTDV